MAADSRSPVSGLTEQEAKELHSGFMTMTILYVAIAVVAHILMWMWRPWFPGTKAYQSGASLDLNTIVSSVTTLLT